MSSRRIKTHPSLPRSLQLTMLACRAFALSGPAGFQMVLRPLRRAYLVTRTFARDTELFIEPTTSFGGDPAPCSPGVAGPDGPPTAPRWLGRARRHECPPCFCAAAP
jgi:hypothetical protein